MIKFYVLMVYFFSFEKLKENSFFGDGLMIAAFVGKAPTRTIQGVPEMFMFGVDAIHIGACSWNRSRVNGWWFG